MIITYKKISELKRKVVMVDGCFDPIHDGHISYFKKSARFSYPVVCCVESDAKIISQKKRPVFLTQQKRLIVVDAIKYIQYTLLNTTSTANILESLLPLKYIKGIDWEERELPPDEQAICEKKGIDIIFTKTLINSSTMLLHNFVKNSLINK